MNSQNIEYFETKKIKTVIGNEEPQEYTILLQNLNGPCPLVALVNTLILSDQKIAQKDGSFLSLAQFTSGKDKVSVNGLLEQLGELLVQKLNETDSSTACNADNALSLLPKLVTGLNINVRFNGTFEESPELSLFRIYDVDIVHGWIVDPDDPEYEILNSIDSYDEAVSTVLRDNNEDLISDNEDRTELREKSAAVKHFMDSNATQLTSYGLGQLRALLNPDSPAVLFRNDHFSTVVLKQNCLYILVADQGYKNESNVVWQSLVGTSGNEDAFYNGEWNSHETQQSNQQEQEQEQEQKENYGVGYNAPGDNADYALARELQMEADSEMAQELANQRQAARRDNQNQDRTASTNTGAQRETQSARQQSKKSKSESKKDKKCIIM